VLAMDVLGRGNVDGGTGYGRPRPTYVRELTEVGPGTPMGELRRRYWRPVGWGPTPARRPWSCGCSPRISCSSAMGGAGRASSWRCAHRGTTLYYGRVEAGGIRCCYHGWLFDVEGRCLEQPWEPGDGTQRERMRQPWYPVQERYGLLFRVPGASGPADPPAVGRSRLTV